MSGEHHFLGLHSGPHYPHRQGERLLGPVNVHDLPKSLLFQLGDAPFYAADSIPT